MFGSAGIRRLLFYSAQGSDAADSISFKYSKVYLISHILLGDQYRLPYPKLDLAPSVSVP